MVSHQLMRMGCLNEDRWGSHPQGGKKAQGHGEQGKKQLQKAQDKRNCWYSKKSSEMVLEAKCRVTEQVLSERYPSVLCAKQGHLLLEREKAQSPKGDLSISALISIQTFLPTLGPASSVASCSSTPSPKSSLAGPNLPKPHVRGGGAGGRQEQLPPLRKAAVCQGEQAR